jgi:nitrite reductase/ring-hydroxylating ferredoxin subunit
LTLGEYVLLSDGGDNLLYEQRWPPDWFGRRAVSRVAQAYRPPGDIWFEFLAGKHRGTKVHTQLRPHASGTEVTETYFLPGLPNWDILRKLLGPMVMRQVDRIWNEDLQAGVCIGGWPGLPGRFSRVAAARVRSLPPGTYQLGRAEQFPLGIPVVVDKPVGQVLVIQTAAGFRATHAICPHTGGPLGLGKHVDGCIVCPWHGARFDTASGRACEGPTRRSIPVYATQVIDGELVVIVRDESSSAK